MPDKKPGAKKPEGVRDNDCAVQPGSAASGAEAETRETIMVHSAPGMQGAGQAKYKASEEDSLSGCLQTRAGPPDSIDASDADSPLSSIAGPASPQRYIERSEIARGGMGAIVEIWDKDVRRPVAMKVILESQNNDRVARFVEEAQITGQLEHPNIVPVHEIGVNGNGKVYFTMKMVRGESLDRVIAASRAGANPAAGLSRLLDIFLKICDAVAFAHSRGVVHRDLKPENVMVGAFGEVLVMDWGLSKVLPRKDPADAPSGHADRIDGDSCASRQTDKPDRRSRVASRTDRPDGATGASDDRGPCDPSARHDKKASGDPGLEDRSPSSRAETARSESGSATGRTLEGTVIGTPSYMPPEQADGRIELVDAQSDVWALGGILYTILTGKPPYEGESLANVLVQAVEARIAPPSKRAPLARVPPELEAVCLKAMALKKGLRYRGADALSADVRAFLDLRPVSAYSYGPIERLSKFVQRHPTGSVAAGVSAVLIAIGTLATSFLAQQATISRLAAEAADARRAKAEERAEESDRKALSAETRLSKGRSVTKVARRAEAELGAAVRAMQAVYFSPRPLADLQAVRSEHDAAIDAFRRTDWPDSASKAAALAVEGWILVLSARDEESLELFRRSYDADPDVAIGPVFEAMFWFMKYLDLLKMPSVNVGASGFDFEVFQGEDAAMSDIRTRIESLATKARECSVLGESASDDLEAVVDGIRALANGEMQVAERGLGRALAVPELAWLHAQFRFARSISRYHQKNFSEAIRDIAIVLESLPDHLGALENMGMCLVADGILARQRNADSGPSLRRAVEYFSHGLSLESTHPSLRIGRAIALMTIASHRDKTGMDPLPDLESAMRDLDAAISWNPDIPEAWVCRGSVHNRIAEALERVGIDTRAVAEKALEDSRRAAAKLPHNHVALSNVGNALTRRATALLARGDSTGAIDACNEALDAFSEVVAAAPNLHVARSNRGLALLIRARARIRAGGDPMRDLAAAEDDFTACIAENPKFADFRGNRAMVRNSMAEAMTGEKALEMLRMAEEDATAAIGLDPGAVIYLNNRGVVRADAARLVLKAGGDPGPCFRSAIADYDAALEKAPGHRASRFNRAAAWRSLGDALAESGGNPTGAYESAIRDYEESLKAGVKTTAVLDAIGNTAWRLGEAVTDSGQDPLALYERSVEAFAALNEMRPKDPDTLANLANAVRSAGIALSDRGADGSGHFRRSIAYCDEALRVMGGHRLSLSNRGNARVSLGDHLLFSGADPLQEFRAALADYAESMKVSGGEEAKTLIKVALTRFRIASEERKRGSSEGTIEFSRAIEAFDRVLKEEPRNLQALAYKAASLEQTGRYQEAVAAFEKAAEVGGDSRPDLRMWLARARAIAAAGPWAGDILDSDTHIRAGEYVAAGALLEKGLSAAEKDGAYADGRFAPLLITGNYNLACVKAQASAGKKSPGGKPESLSSGRAASLRAEAISCLRRVMELGHTDLKSVRSDSDLEPLKDDPAFKALLLEWESRLRR